MYSVELYMRVRRACMVDGMSVREASRVFGLHRDTVRKMIKYAGLPQAKASRKTQDRPVHRSHRRDTRRRPQRSEEAAPHRQAHLRAAEGGGVRGAVSLKRRRR